MRSCRSRIVLEECLRITAYYFPNLGDQAGELEVHHTGSDIPWRIKSLPLELVDEFVPQLPIDPADRMLG